MGADAYPDVERRDGIRCEGVTVRESVLTYVTTADFELISCADCGVVFGMPVELVTQKRQNGGRFYCPNGHSLSWKESEVDRLKRINRALSSNLTHERDQRGATERSNRALRGVVTRTRNRIAAGMCPCCRRTFRDLARHMSGQHPDYATEGDQ